MLEERIKGYGCCRLIKETGLLWSRWLTAMHDITAAGVETSHFPTFEEVSKKDLLSDRHFENTKAI